MPSDRRSFDAERRLRHIHPPEEAVPGRVCHVQPCSRSPVPGRALKTCDKVLRSMTLLILLGTLSACAASLAAGYFWCNSWVPVQVLPRFGMLLVDWQPLQHPQSTVVLADFAAWRPLLESDAQRDNIFQVHLSLALRLVPVSSFR